MTKVIDSVLSINTIEQQFIMLKGMLQLTRLHDHTQTIGIDQSLSNYAIYEHKCLENTKNDTNKLLSVTISNNSKILLRLPWFLLLKDSPTPVLYLPWHQHQSRNELLENHCACLLLFLKLKKNCLPSS